MGIIVASKIGTAFEYAKWIFSDASSNGISAVVSSVSMDILSVACLRSPAILSVQLRTGISFLIVRLIRQDLLLRFSNNALSSAEGSGEA
jgi:hypothetical protein